MLARSSVSQINVPPRPSTRVTNSLIVHASGGVQLPNALIKLSLLLRLSFGSPPGLVVQLTMNFMLAPPPLTSVSPRRQIARPRGRVPTTAADPEPGSSRRHCRTPRGLPP